MTKKRSIELSARVFKHRFFRHFLCVFLILSVIFSSNSSLIAHAANDENAGMAENVPSSNGVFGESLVDPLPSTSLDEASPASLDSVPTAPSSDSPQPDLPVVSSPAAPSPEALSLPNTLDSDTKPDQTKDTDTKKDKKDKKDGSGEVSALAGTASTTTNENNRTNTKVSGQSLKVEALASSGALSAHYPLTTPPSRAGLTPSLSLSYNSSNKTNDSFYGYGWDLPLASVSELSKHTPSERANPHSFSLDLFGASYEIVPIGIVTNNVGAYSPKVHQGEFANIEYRSDGRWVVNDKVGTTYTFGQNAASRQDNPANPADIHRWFIESIKDANQNTVTFEYYKDMGQVYPKRIRYTGNNALAPSDPLYYGTYAIEFEPFASLVNLTPRPDATISYKAGFKTETKYRVNSIVIKANGAERRRYTFSYQTGDNGKRSLLSSITESGKDETGTTITLPATTFAYQTKTIGWKTASESAMTLPANKHFQGSLVPNSPFADVGGSYFLELNGDGFNDIYADYDTQEAWINSTTGAFSKTPWSRPATNGTPLYFDGGLFDFNNDGLTDLYSSGGDQSTQGVYLNDGQTGWTIRDARWDGVSFGSTGKQKSADVNGDGLTDAVVSDYFWNNNFGVINKEVYINNGKGYEKRTDFQIPVYLSGTGGGGVEVCGSICVLLDVNGDGLTDIVKWGEGSNPSEIYFNNGINGWEMTPSTTWQLPKEPNGLAFVEFQLATTRSAVQFGDINRAGS